MEEIEKVVEEEEEMICRDEVERCIYKVPDWLKYHVCDNGNDRTPYEPEIISFGPYHWGNPRFKEMDEHKKRCLDVMLSREGQHVDEYREEIWKIRKKVRACYQGLIEETDSIGFVDMLVLDGCFMLEFLRVIKVGLMDTEYEYNDPVFSKHTIMQVIASDMIKLENQLPLMVLEKLLSLQYERLPMENKKHIAKLVLQALTPIWITNQMILTNEQLITMSNAVAADPDNTMLHCLDIFRSGLLYNSSDQHQVPVDGLCCLNRSNSDGQGAQNNGPENWSYSTMMMSCVAELIEAGVKFTTRNSQQLWDLKFNKRNGFLEIPSIKIDGATKTVFLNLIAYEQCHLRRFWKMPITNYVMFMSNLVKSASDVSHLNQAKIIVNQLGSDAEVANLFNGLVKKALVDWKEDGLLELSVKLNRYCTHRRHRWCANLEHDYLKNPWVIISIVAALILFLLTIVQTFYAVLAYHKPPKSD